MTRSPTTADRHVPRASKPSTESTARWAASPAPRRMRRGRITSWFCRITVRSLGATFLQRYGKTVDSVIRQLMGGADEVAAAVDEVEQWRVVNTFVSELRHARGAKTVAQTAIRTRERRRATRQVPVEQTEKPDLVVCASGNLALVYFPDIEGRVTLEQLNERFPNMVEALANHPGVGLLLVQVGRTWIAGNRAQGVLHLSDRSIEGEDPLADYGEPCARRIGPARRDGQLRRCGSDQRVRSRHSAGCGLRGPDRVARRPRRPADRRDGALPGRLGVGCRHRRCGSRLHTARNRG